MFVPNIPNNTKLATEIFIMERTGRTNLIKQYEMLESTVLLERNVKNYKYLQFSKYLTPFHNFWHSPHIPYVQFTFPEK